MHERLLDEISLFKDDVSYINMYFEGEHDKQVHTNILKFLEMSTVKRISGLKPVPFDGSSSCFRMNALTKKNSLYKSIIFSMNI